MNLRYDKHCHDSQAELMIKVMCVDCLSNYCKHIELARVCKCLALSITTSTADKSDSPQDNAVVVISGNSYFDGNGGEESYGGSIGKQGSQHLAGCVSSVV